MEYRRLGRTNLRASAIGLGLEYLQNQPRETVVSTVRCAIDGGINYFDVIFSMPDYLDNMGAAFAGQRERVILTGHLGSTEKKGQYAKSRSIKRNEQFFQSVLTRLNTDFIDILFLHNCDRPKDFEKIFKPNGQVDLARRLRDEGKAHFIGFSGHTPETALQAVESGHVDVLMFPVSMLSHAVEARRDLLNACIARDVAVVAMKPFGGGKLLQDTRTIRVNHYLSGTEPFSVKKTEPITPIQCLGYVLAQAGISVALPGCKNVAEVEATLAYNQASLAERDFSALLADFDTYHTGECVYCNHCLPCPAEIDIGQTMRLLDMARVQLTEQLQAQYGAMPATASDCTECGACVERCPFEVDVTAGMREAMQAFAA